MDAGTVDTDEDSIRDGGPGGVVTATVETTLEQRLGAGGMWQGEGGRGQGAGCWEQGAKSVTLFGGEDLSLLNICVISDLVGPSVIFGQIFSGRLKVTKLPTVVFS